MQTASNPYEDLLDQRRPQTSGRLKVPPIESRPCEQDNRLQPVEEQDNGQTIMPSNPSGAPSNNAGVKITVNDEPDDIVGQELPSSNRFVSSMMMPPEVC